MADAALLVVSTSTSEFTDSVAVGALDGDDCVDAAMQTVNQGRAQLLVHRSGDCRAHVAVKGPAR